MCSNNTSSGSYGGDLQEDYLGSCPKKQKKDKVRRRGPGVAELEKIRLEEENKSPSLPVPHSSTPSLPNIDYSLFPYPLLPSPPKTSFYTTNTIFRPPATATANGGCDLVMTPPNFALPSYFTNRSFAMDLIPPAPVFQSKQHSLNHPMMNLANPSLGQGRICQFIEPPSNQRSCVDNVSQCLEEERKMVSAKRPWHLLADTTKASVEPISRDRRQSRSLDMEMISPVQDSGTSICNPIPIDSPTTIQRDYPRFIPLKIQHEQQQQQQDFDENMQWRSKKTMYSFIPSNDRSNVDREQRACERHEAAADHGIDLSLKL